MSHWAATAKDDENKCNNESSDNDFFRVLWISYEKCFRVF